MTETETKSGITFTSVREARFVFFLVFVGVLSLTYGLFFAIDFLPEKPGTEMQEVAESVSVPDTSLIESTDSENTDLDSIDEVTNDTDRDIPTHTDTDTSTETELQSLSSDDIYPTQIVFDSLDGRTVLVQNPNSRDIAVLDAALLKGVVRHPDSGDFERIGTIVLFGHSSYLPNVMNKNFQAFNGIQKLTWGDIIRLESESREYVYRVDRVYEASASDASAEVKVEAGKRKLTLVTCDSFGSMSDRFIVEASLIEESDRKG